MKMKNRIKRCGIIGCMSTVLLVASCSQGYDDDYRFSSGVEGVVLESPKAENLKFTPNADATKVTVSWPVVYGAGGYQFSLYIVDNPSNPVVVGEENQIVDGCSVERDLLEDTKYKVVIKTLGNDKYKNKEATSATEVAYNTLIPATIIPAGTDLTTFFSENQYENNSAFELLGGAEYHISGDINLEAKNIVIRGDKVNRPNVVVKSGKFVSKGASVRFKFINFDLSNISNELINYAEPSDELPIQGADNYSVVNPVLIQECKITGMTYRLLSSSSSKKYFISSVIIRNSIIEMDKITSAFIQFSGSAFIKDFTIENCTFNNKKGGSKSQRFLQYGNGNIQKSGNAQTNLILTNNTFYNISYAQSMANYSMMRQKTYRLIIKKNIFIDCGNQKVISGLAGGNGNPVRECDQNSYWYNGAFPVTEISDNNGDKSGTHFEVDPGVASPDAGNFTISAAELITARIGDPRWLPAQ